MGDMGANKTALVPIGEVFSDLPGTGQARHHFTQADQVDQLVRAGNRIGQNKD